ncbi:hypothetical protein HWV62_28475 [Athelia sp. TMB]|nr:hypothetical protein HWV62_28475 [Athelia sp. TMB]
MTARAKSPSPIDAPHQPSPIPTIRLVPAPSTSTSEATSSSSIDVEAGHSFIGDLSAASGWSAESSWAMPSPIAPKTESRKRLVPKKSKLGLLGSNREKRKDDFSDVARRVGAPGSASAGRAGFDIYVDQNQDPDLGSMLLVKKKKSRAALDGMKWGALGEVTNVPSTQKPGKETGKAKDKGLLKVKGDEKDKWWSIGRGRKDSKDKVAKEPARAKCTLLSILETYPLTLPQAPEPIDTRARSHSLDSGRLLGPNIRVEAPKEDVRAAASASSSNLLAVPGMGSKGDSVAIRAMRSVRSMALLASWTQPKEEPAPSTEASVPTRSSKGDEKDKKKKRKTKKSSFPPPVSSESIRNSGSSFEAGQLTPSPHATASKSLGAKKKSLLELGLGFAATMRLPKQRNGSTGSSLGGSGTPISGRHSLDPAIILNGGPRGRLASTLSGGSSLRPISVASGDSAGSSAASVKWDEQGLKTVKEMRKKERASVDAERGRSSKESTRGSRRSAEGWKRTPVTSVFPHNEGCASLPLLTLEEATMDGHDSINDSLVSTATTTPVKKARPRPMSEQLLGKSRPEAMHGEEESGVMSVLSAATNDLAQLINYLDLEATPATPDCSPIQPELTSAERIARGWSASQPPLTVRQRVQALESPIKKQPGLREKVASISSLRPYALRTQAAPTVPEQKGQPAIAKLIGQQIAPWSELDWETSPLKKVPPPTKQTFMRHKRTMTPAQEAEDEMVFQPLRPAKKSGTLILKAKASAVSIASHATGATSILVPQRSPSSLTFGSQSTAKKSVDNMQEQAEDTPTPSPIFKRARGHVRQRSSLVPADLQSAKQPMPKEVKRALGMGGTMGGSDCSAYMPQEEVDASDPDSDIPEELQVILATHEEESPDDTMSYRPQSTDGSPCSLTMDRPYQTNLRPTAPLSIGGKTSPLRGAVIDEDKNQMDLDDAISLEEDTKKSFDFTGELKKLNQSGASERRSFVEQLENAFRTPAKINLRYAFDGALLGIDAPPLPKMPSRLFNGETIRQKKSVLNYSLPMDTNKVDPTELSGSDSLAASEEFKDEVSQESPHSLKGSSSMSSRQSDGELKKDFKFGGRPSPTQTLPVSEGHELTLSDIIPPPQHVEATFNISAEDDSVLKSILMKATTVLDIPTAPAPRVRVDSNASFKPRARLSSNASSKRRSRASVRFSRASYRHSRMSSGASFAGFDSFAEVRRGFEFSQDRPAFYPPPAAATRRRHAKRESLLSIASVSSYGHVINGGSTDPFDFGDEARLPDIQSEDDMSISMSMSVDDTFAFIHERDAAGRNRQRVESDASSFYFHAPAQSHMIQPYNRAHRRHSSAFSGASVAPPVSMHNRNFGVHRNSFGAHRRIDSDTSASSMAFSYAMHGANGGRASWARHRHDSIDSIMSDFSVRRLGRPGVGDKMFESAQDYCMPLTAISASPPASLTSKSREQVLSYDSIMDDEGHRSSTEYDNERRSASEDSLFDQSGTRSSSSSESVFGVEGQARPRGGLQPAYQFRPLSTMSFASPHSPNREDDTMISMLGGGHVRRRSVASVIETSPCVRVEKKIQKAQPPKMDAYFDSPNHEACIVEKPSISSSYKFGGERMIRAQQGLYERRSLEESCLVAAGEDISMSLRVEPVFTRPSPVSRSRSSTCTSSSACTSSSGADTPPLSIAGETSQSEGGSQSSIDLSRVSIILANSSYPTAGSARDRARARARGDGHRRRISQAQASRTQSIYETIEEELMSNASSEPASPLSLAFVQDNVLENLHGNSSVFVVDPETASLNEPVAWDDDSGIMAMRKYYTLKEEAQDMVTDSKRVWADTPFSLYALQSFVPPKHPAGMQAMLQHSIDNYGPLSSELRRVRSRTISRPSPYPQSRAIKTPVTSDHRRPIAMDKDNMFVSNPTPKRTPTAALQPVSFNPNLVSQHPPVPKLDALKGSPMVPESELVKTFGLPRPRVPSNARRSALGWSKRSTGKENKENNVSLGSIKTPSESLRINRPRPRGRPTPGSARPIRV